VARQFIVHWFGKALLHRQCIILACVIRKIAELFRLQLQIKLNDEVNMSYQLCQNCFENRGTQYHHKFSNSKVNRRKYGKVLIGDERNLMLVCAGCNSSHAKLKVLTEREFCEMMGILKCVLCRYDLDGQCIHYDKMFAMTCRDFYFDKDKYYGRE